MHSPPSHFGGTAGVAQDFIQNHTPLIVGWLCEDDKDKHGTKAPSSASSSSSSLSSFVSSITAALCGRVALSREKGNAKCIKHNNRGYPLSLRSSCQAREDTKATETAYPATSDNSKPTRCMRELEFPGSHCCGGITHSISAVNHSARIYSKQIITPIGAVKCKPSQPSSRQNTATGSLLSLIMQPNGTKARLEFEPSVRTHAGIE